MTAETILRYLLDLMEIGPEGRDATSRPRAGRSPVYMLMKRTANRTLISVRFERLGILDVAVNWNLVDLSGVGFFARWRFRRACFRFHKRVVRFKADRDNSEIFETLIADAAVLEA